MDHREELAQAERHIAGFKDHIFKQNELLSELRHDRRDVQQTTDLLVEFEEGLFYRRQNRDLQSAIEGMNYVRFEDFRIILVGRRGKIEDDHCETFALR